MARTWRCFFCNEVFRSRKTAWIHFGDDGCTTDPPACVDPLRTDEKERFRELREAREWALERDRKAQTYEDHIEILSDELSEFKKLTGCSSAHQLRMWLDSLQGRVATAEALIKGFREKDPRLVDEIVG